MRKQLIILRHDFYDWARGWYFYLERHLRRAGARFEKYKSVIVDVLMARRGTYQRPFLHFSLGMLFVVGAISAPILADSYPGTIPGALADFTPPSAVLTSLDPTEYGIQTQKSDKPRDQVISYAVQSGDTISRVADKFGISVDTIRWANDLFGDNLRIGQELKIPPVTGIVHKVKEGDTIYSVAKKYKTDAQKIINYPFNNIDLDTFALSVGDILIVPEGVQPQAPAIIAPAPPVYAGGTGQFLWPTNGVVTQYPIWYHMALDIANSAAPGIGAADEGMVILVEYLRYGYGEHVLIGHGDGLSTLYAHMQEIYVKVGDRVARGQIIGKMGSTGRSTGTHLHFEVRKNGVTVNPLPFLR